MDSIIGDNTANFKLINVNTNTEGDNGVEKAND